MEKREKDKEKDDLCKEVFRRFLIMRAERKQEDVSGKTLGGMKHEKRN